MLKKKKYTFHSNTDTEVVVNLVQEIYQKNSTLETAFIEAIRELEGTFAIVLFSTHNPQKLYAVKKNSPIIIGLGEKKIDYYFCICIGMKSIFFFFEDSRSPV